MSDVKLTDAQAFALRCVVDGHRYVLMVEGRRVWKSDRHFAAMQPRPYERLVDLGLVKVWPETRTGQCRVTATAAGCAAVSRG